MRSQAEESFYRAARGWAQCQARRFGIEGDLADEFEQSFVVGWLLNPGQPPIWTWSVERRDPFLRRAARNYALNFLRKQRRETAHVTAYALSAQDRAEEARETWPETHLVRHLFWQQIESGLARLRPDTSRLFVRYHLGSATVDELSSASGRTNHAVNQHLSRVRQRLRSILAAQGSTESELRSYVSLLRRPPLPIPRSASISGSADEARRRCPAQPQDRP